MGVRKRNSAISRGRDDLAKAALKERSVHEDAARQTESEIEAIDGAIDKMKGDTHQLEEKLKGARARQKSLIVRGKTAKHRIKVRRQVNDASYEEAFDKFDRYERRIDELEGEIESYDLASRSLSDEIEDLARGEELDAQLQALKNRLDNPSGTRAQG
ncbi:MAG: PspA/IM30 family protein [Gammaproteobacteria bacterium]|nr:PspA/IM30 family protein [Gammaproteobacteria bacterium]